MFWQGHKRNQSWKFSLSSQDYTDNHRATNNMLAMTIFPVLKRQRSRYICKCCSTCSREGSIEVKGSCCGLKCPLDLCLGCAFLPGFIWPSDMDECSSGMGSLAALLEVTSQVSSLQKGPGWCSPGCLQR